VTSPFAADLARLRQEIAVATFPDGGVLLHFRSGDIFQLDATTATVWNALTDPPASGGADSVERVAELVARQLGMSAAQALSFVQATIEGALGNDHSPPSTAYRIEDDDALLSLWKGRRPLLVLDRRTSALTLCHRSDPGEPYDEDDLPAVIRMFIPKILAIRFPLTLHAAALELGGRAILFSGESGAGKTTTARTVALEIEGARISSEDIVVFSTVGTPSLIVDGAENVIWSWIDEAARAFRLGPQATVDVQRLIDALEAQRHLMPLKKTIFLAASRRRGTSWSFRDLGPTQALSALFLNSFLQSAAPSVLRGHLKACQAVASGAAAVEATTVPEGLSRLREGSRAQSAMIAS
jgi:hypothetical protein